MQLMSSEKHLSRNNLFAALDTNNLLRTGEMMARAALYREETRGTHIRADYPATDDCWMKHICITRRGREMVLSTVPVGT